MPGMILPPETSDVGYGCIGYPAESKPYIHATHIDGPVLKMRNGEIHFLTLWERVLFAMGRVDAFSLEQKYRPDLSYPPKLRSSK